MRGDDFGTPPQSPYRRMTRPRKGEVPEDVSVGFVASFVVFVIVLATALSGEPSPGESFGRLGGWHSGGQAYMAGHHR
jgi:hypothetical protein